MIFTRGRARGLAVLATLLALGACGGPKPAAGPKTYTVAIDKLAYTPESIQLHAGDAVVWVNKDILRHSATAANGAFDVDLAPGASARIVLNAPGAVKVSCRYHPGMTARIEVDPKG